MKKLLRLKKPNLQYKKIAIKMTVLAFVLFGVSGYLAYTRLYLTKERRFWRAVYNNLGTQSVVREITAGGTGNKSVEKTRFSFGNQASLDKLSSISTKSATAESNVVTRSITTPTTQYVSYQDIYTSEKKQNGEPYNFDSIKNVWATQAQATTDEEREALKLDYVQSHVTIVPFGNLTPTSRNEIIKDLKDANVYEFDYTNITDQEIEGRKYVAYPVRVKLKAYVTILQKHFKFMGYGDFPALDPSQYAETARYDSVFYLDPNSNMLRGITMGNQVELYNNFGASVKSPVPSSAIPLEELQEKLQSLQ